MKRKHLGLVLLTLAVTGGTAGAATTPLDGRWTATITQAQLRRAQAAPALVPKLWGPWTARYGDGRFEFRNQRTGTLASGTFTVQDKIARVVFARGVGLKPGAVSVCTWSIYNDRLTFRAMPGRPSLLCDAGVWTRAS